MNEREWREQIDEHESNHHELSPEDCPVLTCRLAAKIRELEGRLKRRRMFPIMDGPAVPWEAMEQHEGQAQQNHWQSLQELASRGGLDVLEAWCVVDAIPFRDCPDNVSQLWEDYAYHWNDLVRRAEADAKALQRVKEDGLVRCFNTHIANACGHDALRKCRGCLWNEENP